MISIDRTQKRVILTRYISTEEKYAIVWVQAISSRGIVGIGHFMQNKTKSSTWGEIMKKRIMKLNKEKKWTN